MFNIYVGIYIYIILTKIEKFSKIVFIYSIIIVIIIIITYLEIEF